MRLKFALLATVGALVALAAPASSMAGFHPINTKFEIKGDSHGPKLTTSLGSCSLTKISGTTPSNETTNLALIPTPTPGACSTGASITLGGTWGVEAHGPFDLLVFGGVELRYASLPGCRLSGSIMLAGAYNNSAVSGVASVYHPESTGTMAWQNDTGKTCALAGQKEAFRYEDMQANGAINVSSVLSVSNLTSPTIPVWIR